MTQNEYQYIEDYTDNVKDHFHDQLEALHDEIRRSLEEAARNQQAFEALEPIASLTPAMSLSLTETFREHYLTR